MISRRISLQPSWKKVEVTRYYHISQHKIKFNNQSHLINLKAEEPNSALSKLKELQMHIRNNENMTEKKVFEALKQVYNIKKKLLGKELSQSDSDVMQSLLQDNVSLLSQRMYETFDDASSDRDHKLKSLLALNKIDKRRFFELLDRHNMTLSNRCLLVESKILGLKSEYKSTLKRIKYIQFFGLLSSGLAVLGVFLIFLYFLIQYDVYYFDPKATDYHLYRFRS